MRNRHQEQGTDVVVHFHDNQDDCFVNCNMRNSFEYCVICSVDGGIIAMLSVMFIMGLISVMSTRALMLITTVMALMTVMSVMPMKTLMTVVSGMYMMILKNVTTVVSMIFFFMKVKPF